MLVDLTKLDKQTDEEKMISDHIRNLDKELTEAKSQKEILLAKITDKFHKEYPVGSIFLLSNDEFVRRAGLVSWNYQRRPFVRIDDNKNVFLDKIVRCITIDDLKEEEDHGI